MPYLPSLPETAGPPHVFKRYPSVYAAFSEMSEALMNGPSPLSRGERELLLAYAAGVMGCDFVLTGHRAVAEAHGVGAGLIDALLAGQEAGEPKLRPLLAYVACLAATPEKMTPALAQAVLAAGWEEQALHDAAAITGRAAFMHRLVAGMGFAPLDPAVAASHAQKRVERGYVHVYKPLRPTE